MAEYSKTRDMNRDFEQDEEASFAPARTPVDINSGALVRKAETVYRIAHVVDFASVVAVDVQTGKSQVLPIAELRAVVGTDDNAATQAADLDEIADSEWREAEKRFSAIRPLIENPLAGVAEIQARANEIGVDMATLYRWLKKYRATGSVVSLIAQKRGWKSGKSRISPMAEMVIEQVIKDYYLTVQRPTQQKAVLEVQRRCSMQGVDAPSPGTVRLRLARIPEREQLNRRGYRERAKNKFTPAAGAFPNADYPLAVVQIDHTPADIILVDDLHRKPIGRPWITLAIDVYSRMITGYYLSFDPPSETSVAMCVAHSMLPKEDWLLLHQVDSDWPVWGRMKTIHVDNGADFRSDNFRRSCLAYGINLEFRPVRQPRYGGHIERVLGSLLRDIHALPGTTFSSVKDKDGYDAEKHAVMTKSEFERWLVMWICKVYHEREHSSLGISPFRQWEIGVFGNAGNTGTGIPSRPADPHTVLLDFLPSFRRTVQTFGVTIDNLTYYAEVLRPWINATDPDEPRRKRELVFRRDPRDVSSVWFYDPQLKQYFKIPFADQSLPSMSIWEYEQARQRLKQEQGEGASVSNLHLLRAITQMRSHVDEATENTKRARRQAQRRAEHGRKVTPSDPLASVNPEKAPPTLKGPPTVSALTFLPGLDGTAVRFGDVA